MLKSLRNTKFAYSLYNFFHKEHLKHNIPLYKKYGLKKRYFSPISSKDFAHLPDRARHLDTQKLRENVFFSKLDEKQQQSLLSFNENGFALIEGFLDERTVNEVNGTIDELMRTGTINFVNRNKLMFAIHHSDLLKQIGENPDFIHLLSILMGGSAKLFQSINFITGSEQKTHSDSIHMTTYPLGGLIAAWIALEDVDETNGALHYYPGSHKLPYYFNADYDNEGSFFFLGKKGYGAYEKMLGQKIAEKGLEKTIFRAKKGDAFIWHANLMHGGEPHRDKNTTRKSMVFHYFDEESICYHEITQRPALFK